MSMLTPADWPSVSRNFSAARRAPIVNSIVHSTTGGFTTDNRILGIAAEAGLIPGTRARIGVGSERVHGDLVMDVTFNLNWLF